MAENSQSFEDQASLYVLGRLASPECEAFEALLEQSPDLLKLVTELEDGSLAMALASPPRIAPAAVWERVAESISNEERWSLSRTPWLRTAGAAAAACIAGWFLHALWIHSSSEPATPMTVETIAANSHPTTSDATIDTAISRRSGVTGTNVPLPRPAPTVQERDGLRVEVTALRNQMNQMQQVLARQEAALSEPNRPKFFQLSPDASAPPPSPELQQVLFTVMARELGWQQPSGSPSGFPSSLRTVGTNGAVTVDFVDFRQGTNSAAAPETLQASTEIEVDPIDPLHPVATGGSAPVFVAGNNAFVAIDSSVMPGGSYVTFWTGTQDGQLDPIGTTVLGDRPTVFGLTCFTASSVPLSVSGLNGSTFAVTWGSVPGLVNSTNVLGQFTAPGNAP